MPFLGQDWRSPGWSWIKTEDGWKRCESWSRDLERETNPRTISHSIILNSDDEEIFSNEEQEYTSKKRKKDHFRNDTDTQCFYREKWIYVHKESTRERHGYCTLGEAFNRLDFSSAIQDIRRFTYVVKLLQLIAKSQLTSLSGVAQKNYFNVLDKIVRKVLDDHQNPRLIKDLLQDLSSTLCILIRGVGKSVLVGNINIWICRLETILHWQQQLQNLQVTKQVNDGLTLSDLPLHMLNNILYRLSDGWDIVTLGQVTPTLSMLSEDRRLWKKLCQYHFAEKQRLLGSKHQPDAAPQRPLSLHHSLVWKTSPPSGTTLRAACPSPRPQPAAPHHAPGLVSTLSADGPRFRSTAGGRQGRFHLVALTNSTAVNTAVHVFVWTWVCT
ncbi:F-box only protein 25 isoform X3 [Eumetopias jubatus]|uniref:F-box only protein 25 isoform X3 n=1 Tax=Eumetopias jubatus TaxID=34886 RepID=UPI0010170776|nr:F-box only protein 25 isoform X3 [Eumetopias jubatus]